MYDCFAVLCQNVLMYNVTTFHAHKAQRKAMVAFFVFHIVTTLLGLVLQNLLVIMFFRTNSFLTKLLIRSGGHVVIKNLILECSW